ncbi:MAG: hypothetical protein HY887_07515 [Deltaproteobacteria bacterium]|nr:hypothetical protein [Deltaproteobacteria bacterium]
MEEKGSPPLKKGGQGGQGGFKGHEREELKRITVLLEEEQVEMLRALAAEYKGKLGQRWTISAMVRVAVGDFLTKMGKFA